MTAEPADAGVGHLLRALTPQVLGAVARRYNDFGRAEDAVQEALIAAAEQWPVEGIPDNPGGWFYRVAVRRMADRLRSDRARRNRENVVARERAAAERADHPADLGYSAEKDDTLVLLFMCCHPALTAPTAIALTLSAVGGHTTKEIANAFLVPEATTAQRISRAKRNIKASGIPFSMPSDDERDERLRSVLHVLYLIFSEGYVSSSGTHLQRVELSNEAIRLTRIVHRHLPENAEVAGLLALMLLTDARRAARSGPSGELIPLDEQDRGLWDQSLISEVIALISDTLSKGSIGLYQLQAAIAAVHDVAANAEDTDLPQMRSARLSARNPESR